MASALLVDYVLTVAVSSASGRGQPRLGVCRSSPTTRCRSRSPRSSLLTAVNLRGIRESGTAFAIPTYGFMIVILGMVATGLFRLFVLGDDLQGTQRRT